MGAYRVYSVEVIIQAFQAWARGSNPRARIESFCAGERALHAREQAEPPAGICRAKFATTVGAFVKATTPRGDSPTLWRWLGLSRSGAARCSASRWARPRARHCVGE